MEPLDDVPWVLVGALPGAHGPILVARCQVCGASAQGHEAQIDAFADRHAQHRSSSQTHMGAGDLVSAAAKAIGFTKPCTPCEQRRQALNNAVPRVPFFRR